MIYVIILCIAGELVIIHRVCQERNGSCEVGGVTSSLWLGVISPGIMYMYSGTEPGELLYVARQQGVTSATDNGCVCQCVCVCGMCVSVGLGRGGYKVEGTSSRLQELILCEIIPFLPSCLLRL